MDFVEIGFYPQQGKIHFRLNDGSFPRCAGRGRVERRSFGVGLRDIVDAGLPVCSKCAHRFDLTPEEIDARGRALLS